MKKIPPDFKYRTVLEKGQPVHDGDSFSTRHPHMSNAQRAKIFAPFAALKGFDEEVCSKNVIYTEKKILPEERIYALNDVLSDLYARSQNAKTRREHPLSVSVVFFDLCSDPHHEAYGKKGVYRTVSGRLKKVDPVNRLLFVGDEMIAFSDLLQIVAISPKSDRI